MNWDCIFRDLGRTVQIHFYISQSVRYLDPELTFVGPVRTREMFTRRRNFFRKQQFFLHICRELANIAFFASKTAGADLFKTSIKST